MSKSRSERTAALEGWVDLVEPEDLKIADTSGLKVIARACQISEAKLKQIWLTLFG